MANTFDLLPYRYHFRALDPVRFPAGKAGNVFRGAFGTILREIACVPGCPGAGSCARRVECAYARLFEPTLEGLGPSGFANPPRPFVLRASHLDGSILPPGSEFFVDVNVFDARFPARHWFERVFERLAENGIGPGRGRARLATVEDLGPRAVSLDCNSQTVTKVTVQFVTPTELKSGAEIRNEPDFEILFSRIRDRISSLRALYGPAPLEIDFRGLADRAAAIRTVRSDLQHEHSIRRSTRTGQVHSLGGLTGEVEYEGDLAEFLPWIECAFWTGVGRQTVWGKGQLRIIIIRFVA